MIKKRVCDICGVDVLTPKGVKGYTEYEDYQEVHYPNLIAGCMDVTLIVHFCANFAKGGDMCQECAIRTIKKASRDLRK